MRFFKDKAFRDAALDRAIRTFCQSLGTSIPVGLVISPVMIQDADWTIYYIIVAWLLTGFLAGLASLLTSIATGLPEIDNKESENETRYDN